MSDNFTVAVAMHFWLHIEADNKNEANKIAERMLRNIQKRIEEEHENTQGEMLAQSASEAYACTREEAWESMEALDMTERGINDRDDDHARHTLALHVASSDQ